jgi:pyruvate dehydrogenase E2 component (dihydrolipoamide acetyltransferase)
MPDVTMPRLSDSMEEGTILKWLKGDGDEVSQGDELAEIETDKATMTYEADLDGTLRIVAQEGDTLAIGEVIAKLLAPGEAEGGGGDGGGDGGAQQGRGGASDGVEDAPGADAEGGSQALTEEQSGEVRTDMPAQGDGQSNGDGPGTQAAAPSATGDGADGRVKASPVARRIARERGVDLGSLQGSGPGGRIVKADVEAAAAGGGDGGGAQAPAQAQPAGDGAPAQEEQAEPAKQPQPAAAQGERGTAKGDVTVQDLTRTQQVIARRMAESKATIPEFTLTTEIDMEEAVALRARLKQLAGEGGVTPSYNDIIIKSCARALKAYPRANGTYKDGKFELFTRVNVGFAVAAHDALIVPTVFDADQKTLGEIARETRGLIGKVREGTISPPELSGGTFNVSNLGMYGITNFTAVINPPQAAILAVGAMQPKPVVVDGEVTVRQRMEVTLTCDHRILYGADAAEFLGAIRKGLEQPLTLAL